MGICFLWVFGENWPSCTSSNRYGYPYWIPFYFNLDCPFVLIVAWRKWLAIIIYTYNIFIGKSDSRTVVATQRVHDVTIADDGMTVLRNAYLFGAKWSINYYYYYRQTSNVSRTLVGNKIVDHSDVVGALPVGAVPTTFQFSNQHLASMDLVKTTSRPDEKHFSFGI